MNITTTKLLNGLALNAATAKALDTWTESMKNTDATREYMHQATFIDPDHVDAREFTRAVAYEKNKPQKPHFDKGQGQGQGVGYWAEFKLRLVEPLQTVKNSSGRAPPQSNKAPSTPPCIPPQPTATMMAGNRHHIPEEQK
ncbi:hypothetical protein B0H17DRAFT_1133997 [Mycena rosella]|uniref:Uncharacterized protein n=1 Tax=Mycena rosella TaxID=1033263 RepID=A0AAD7GJK0_MYCRO|nr:hypothetical protein B0H17DRAFT_1133997 [Mycena rosella]